MTIDDDLRVALFLCFVLILHVDLRHWAEDKAQHNYLPFLIKGGTKITDVLSVTRDGGAL